MNGGNIIYTLLTLLAVILFLLSPVLKKIFSSVEKNSDRGVPHGDDPAYESVDSRRVVDRSFSNLELKPSEERNEYAAEEEPHPMRLHKLKVNEEVDSAVKRIEALSSLKKAVVWKEILDRPVSMRE